MLAFHTCLYISRFFFKLKTLRAKIHRPNDSQILKFESQCIIMAFCGISNFDSEVSRIRNFISTPKLWQIYGNFEKIKRYKSKIIFLFFRMKIYNASAKFTYRFIRRFRFSQIKTYIFYVKFRIDLKINDFALDRPAGQINYSNLYPRIIIHTRLRHIENFQ